MDAKQESEKLMNEMLPVAEKMLREHGEFFPYGGYMRVNGEIVHVGIQDYEADHPKSQDVLDDLRRSLREVARTNACKATAVVFDVAVKLPRTDCKSDAIQVCLDHVDRYSAEVFLPYRLVANEVVYEETFAQAGQHDIFGTI
jgi:hypothetical protein